MIFLWKRPAQTKAAAASLTSRCLFSVITCGTIESAGQGEARAEQHQTDAL